MRSTFKINSISFLIIISINTLTKFSPCAIGLPDETSISFENTQLVQGYEHSEQLYQAIRDEQVLRITYKAFQAPAEEVFTLHPYYLKEYRERWYIFGLVTETNTIYNLALDASRLSR